MPGLSSAGQVTAEVREGGLGVLTLNRPASLNALSLPMVRDLSAVLRHWQHDAGASCVLLQGAGRAGRPPAFCAGGDIRALHQAALAGDPSVDDFFTEEYALDHLIHHFGKPVAALMDGITMGGGMGLAQGASLRVVTEHSQLAMPETLIGLFPDVGGGWFLSRCPGRLGEYLALSGQVLNAGEAMACGLADLHVPSSELPAWIEAWARQPGSRPVAPCASDAGTLPLAADSFLTHRDTIDRHFSAPSLPALFDALAADPLPWCQDTLALLSKRSPLMLAVTLEHIRRARRMDLAAVFRMERAMVRRCFHRSDGLPSETIEGIRARVIDKDHQPRWTPAHWADVTPAQVAAFFESPWPAWAHPLRDLA